MKLFRRLISGSLAMLLALWVLLPNPCLANPGLRVTGVLLEAAVSPGEVITYNMNVGIRENDAAMDIGIEVRDLGSLSAKNFITIDNPSFHLEPGESRDVTATINIPPNVGDGGRYAIIHIAQKPVAGAKIAVVVAVDVPVRLTIKNSRLIHTGKITELATSKAISGQPVDIFTTLQNTGNHHFKFNCEITISNAQGQVLETIDTALSPSPVIPSMTEQLKVSFIPKAQLPLGVYSVKSRLTLEDGTVLDEASGSFEVQKPYVPPPAPASITLTPSSASTLKTGDGRISISFPQGAVISQVEVSLRSYPLEQIPAPPPDFALATTCFRVDGLTGLLAKEAAVTVKYTPADLDKAGGDASRLRLARWDEADKQWTVLNTEIDKAAMTLTTHTNQLSIWTVMVAPPGGTNWALIGGAAAGVIIVALLIFFLVRRRAY